MGILVRSFTGNPQAFWLRAGFITLFQTSMLPTYLGGLILVAIVAAFSCL
jgi:hypothetical protein